MSQSETETRLVICTTSPETNGYDTPDYNTVREVTPTYESRSTTPHRSTTEPENERDTTKKGKGRGNVFNRMVGFLGIEGIWPDTMEREIDKASRILSVMTGVAKQPCNVPDAHAGRKSQPFANKIPHSVWKDAKGIAVMTMARTGLSFSGAVGSGIVMSKFADGSWSSPSAFSAQSLGVGVLIGFDVYDVVLILRTLEAVQSFTNPKVTLGGSGSIAAGPVGEGSKVDGGYKQSATISYVKSKGLYIGAQIDTTAFFTRNDENRRAYGRKVKVSEILSGQVELADPAQMRSLRQVLQDASQGSERYWDRCSASLSSQHASSRSTSPSVTRSQVQPATARGEFAPSPSYTESMASSTSDLRITLSEHNSVHSIPTDHKYNYTTQEEFPIYSAQLRALEDMGFQDRTYNQQVLVEVDGNIIKASEVLLGNYHRADEKCSASA